MKKLHLYIFILYFSFCTLYAAPLTYEQAIVIAKENNHEIKIAEFEQRIRQFDLHNIDGMNYGSLDLVNRITRSNDALNVFGFTLQSREASFRDFGAAEFNPLNPDVLSVMPKDLNYPGARTHIQSYLEFKFPLYTGGKLSQYKSMQEALIRLAKLDKQAVVNEKIFEIKKSFFGISLLREYQRNLQVIRSNIAKLESMTQEMISEGYAKNVDLLEVQTKQADINRMLNQSKANEELILQFLSFLLDTEVTDVQSVKNLRYESKVDTSDIARKNISIQKAQEALKLATMNAKVQDAAFLPQVGLFAQYGLNDDSFLPSLDDHDSYTIGVEARWNIFKGGSDSATRQKAKIEQMKREQQLAMAKRGIALQISKIQTQIKTLDFEIDSLHSELELARNIYENYMGRYQEKIVSINDVIIKQSEEIAKTLQLQELQNRRNEKLFALERIVNGENSETIQ